MKIESIELMKITKTDVETKEGKKTVYTAIFEDKDSGIKVNVSQDDKFDLVLGESYSFKIDSEQKKL